jgi:hypothetical protein
MSEVLTMLLGACGVSLLTVGSVFGFAALLVLLSPNRLNK